MTSTVASPGRPRHLPRRREGATGREEILDAAAQMFTEHGYAATSTRTIAMAVGVKQASLYYHFASKEDILAGLLAETVQPSLAMARRLARSGAAAHVQLYALNYYDVLMLCESRWNLGALYGLPELRNERFAEFRADRSKLRAAYGRRIVRGCLDGVFTVGSTDLATTLVFALAESVIGIRYEQDAVHAGTLAPTIAASGLRLLCCRSADLAEAAAGCAGLLG